MESLYAISYYSRSYRSVPLGGLVHGAPVGAVQVTRHLVHDVRRDLLIHFSSVQLRSWGSSGGSTLSIGEDTTTEG
jgi:hypothetical protein